MQTEIGYNNKKVQIHLGKMTIVDEFYTTFEEIEIDFGKRYTLWIHPKKSISLQKVICTIPLKINKQLDNLFCNGFQSWSESKILSFDEKIKTLRWFAQSLMGYYGDYHFKKFVKRKKGFLHSWSYTYLRKYNSDLIKFFGSLNEQNGFTLFTADSKNNLLSIKKNIENVQLEHSFCLLDFIVLHGDEKRVFEIYSTELGFKLPIKPVATGWTSWYNYYNNISENIILKNLNNLVEKEIPIDFFQIDDGWQTHVGDWLSVKNTFPNGMQTISDVIHQKNIKAGLWLAPFIAESNSTLFKIHPDWFLRNENHKLLAVGYSAMWSGKFYALDIYNEAVRAYLTAVFYNVLTRWNFDMVKLDFLYAVCVLPRPNKSRGQVMHDALTFIRDLCGNKIILGCGTPLASGFGIFDYCRIGADIHLQWEHKLLKFLRNRERVSTIVALRTTISRWSLNNVGFLNDPDVFILRKKNQNLTTTQQRTILIVNALLGNLLFISDDISEYDAETFTQYKEIFILKDRIVQSVTPLKKDIYKIHYSVLDKKYDCFINLTDSNQFIENINLLPFQSEIRILFN